MKRMLLCVSLLCCTLYAGKQSITQGQQRIYRKKLKRDRAEERALRTLSAIDDRDELEGLADLFIDKTNREKEAYLCITPLVLRTKSIKSPSEEIKNYYETDDAWKAEFEQKKHQLELFYTLIAKVDPYEELMNAHGQKWNTVFHKKRTLLHNLFYVAPTTQKAKIIHVLQDANYEFNTEGNISQETQQELGERLHKNAHNELEKAHGFNWEKVFQENTQLLKDKLTYNNGKTAINKLTPIKTESLSTKEMKQLFALQQMLTEYRANGESDDYQAACKQFEELTRQLNSWWHLIGL